MHSSLAFLVFIQIQYYDILLVQYSQDTTPSTSHSFDTFTAIMIAFHLSSPVEKGLLISLCKGMVSWKRTLERSSCHLPGNWTSDVNKLVKSVYHVCKICSCKNCSLWQQVIIFLYGWWWCKTCSAVVVYLVFHYHSRVGKHKQVITQQS